MNLSVTRRLGRSPRDRGCLSDSNCPDVLELASGDFAVIGRVVESSALAGLPADAGIGPDERVVVVPREVLVAARTDIPAV